MQGVIMPAIASVTDKSISHVVYSHSHADHIGGAGLLDLPADVEILASQATADALARRAVRPLCSPCHPPAWELPD